MPHKLPPLNIYQHTLAGPMECAGTGLHTAEQTKLSLYPLPADSGVRFVRTDVTVRNNQISLGIDQVVDSRRGTSIANHQAVQIKTVEHLLAALMAFGIDNVQVEVDGPEIPVMDGSAGIFIDLLSRTGLVRQSAPRRYIQILKDIHVEYGASHAHFSPYERFEIDAGIHYENPVIGDQSCQFDVNPQTFTEQIARARTFALRSEVDEILHSGKGSGGTLENCLIVSEDNIENVGGLYFANEFARHKALDALGDLCLAGAPLLCRYRVRRAGHWINHLAVKKLMEDPSSWKYVTFVSSSANDVVHAAE